MYELQSIARAGDLERELEALLVQAQEGVCDMDMFQRNLDSILSRGWALAAPSDKHGTKWLP